MELNLIPCVETMINVIVLEIFFTILTPHPPSPTTRSEEKRYLLDYLVRTAKTFLLI
jgi:hypothetical protein